MFLPHEIEAFSEYARSCKHFVREEAPKHPIGTTYLLSNELPPKGFHHKFSDIGERVLSRCVQNVLFSSYLRVAGQKHVPIAPSLLEGGTEIPEGMFEEVWEKKAFKKQLLVAFLIDFQKLHDWLKTKQGGRWLRDTLKEMPDEYKQIARGITKALTLIEENELIDVDPLINRLEKLGIADNIVSQIITWILPYVESEEIGGRIQYRISPKTYNVVRGLQKIENGENPIDVYEHMKN